MAGAVIASTTPRRVHAASTDAVHMAMSVCVYPSDDAGVSASPRSAASYYCCSIRRRLLTGHCLGVPTPTSTRSAAAPGLRQAIRLQPSQGQPVRIARRLLFWARPPLHRRRPPSQSAPPPAAHGRECPPPPPRPPPAQIGSQPLAPQSPRKHAPMARYIMPPARPPLVLLHASLIPRCRRRASRSLRTRFFLC